MGGTIGLSLDDPALHRVVEDQCRTRGFEVLSGGRAHLDGLITGGLPAVFVDDADAIVSTNVAGAASAIRHLVSYGHTRIAYLGGMRILTTQRDRHRGYLRAIGRRAGPEAHDLRDEAAAERAAIAVLRGPAPPTAIFAAQHQITIGVVRALRRLERTVALVGFDDFTLADLLEPAVTVVAQDPARMGRTAALTLFERIDGDKSAPREIRIPTTLIPRGSGEIPI